jgi:hypothetical protein
MIGEDSIDRSKRGSVTPQPWRPAWVDLRVLFPRLDGVDHRVTDGVDVDREVMGVVQHWIRADGGLWIAQVKYRLPYLDGRPGGVEAIDQWVPATALRSRTERADRGW